MEGGAKLDLLNFDAPKHQSSRHILTSPHSLRACAKLGIKPIELLPKTVEEFSRSARGLGLSASTLTSVYHEYEQQRRAKLRAARRERVRLLSSASHPGSSAQPEPASKPPSNEAASNSSHDPRDASTGGHMTGQTPHLVLGSTTLPIKDWRILSALVERGEEERRLNEMREGVERAWQARRCHDDQAREERRAKHQRELSKSQQRFRKQLEETQSRKRGVAEEGGVALLESLQAKWERWSLTSDLLRAERKQKMEGKKFKDQKRKKQQEGRLQELEVLYAQHKAAVKEYLAAMDAKVTCNKEAQAHREKERIQRRLEVERERFERSRGEVEALAGEEHEELRTALEGKLSSAEDRLALQRAQREAALSRGRDDQRQRCVGQRDKARGIETQLEEWRKEVELYNQMCMLKAEAVYSQRVQQRSLSTRQRCRERERGHAENLKRVLAEEEERRMEMASDLAAKSRRSEELRKSREASLQAAREVALTTAQLRNRVKEHYSKQSFDQMAREAELHASLEKKLPRTLASGSCTQTRYSKTIIA